jgi:hypothetical protein
MSNILMVPIALDALYLQKDRFMVEAMADFSRQPYTDGKTDVHADVANLSEEIVSKPFENQNLLLKAGIHLHWALPDALTNGTHGSSGTDFPAAPNRWLVIRSSSSSAGTITDRSWVVESDYLYPQGNTAAGVSYPFPTDVPQGAFQPFRYLGRKMPLEAWAGDDASSEYLSKLTAVGYGEPSFAAFYPNCHSVFGFFDEDYSGAIPDGLQYDVLGWYADADQDFLGNFVKDLANNSEDPLTIDQLTEALEQKLKWTVEIGADDDFPGRMLCYARITFRQSDSLDNQVLNDPDMTLTVGNTGTEALSAYLAENVDSTRKSTIEDQLESIQLSSRLESQKVDIGPKFKEARHEKGFTSTVSGNEWSIKLDSDDSIPADARAAQAQAQIPLPADLALSLNDLNRLQESYDREIDEIESMRKQLFSDWYKYMLCAYPPEDSRDDYPDIDEVKYYLELKSIAPLTDNVADVGSLVIDQDEAGNVTGASAPQSSEDSLAVGLAGSINDLLSEIAQFNQSTIVEGAKPSYRLKLTPSQRYWQPSEPVVLMVGPAVEPTKRHGQDGSNNEEGLLDCGLLENASIEALIPGDIKTIVTWLDETASSADADAFGFSSWEQQPWNPFLLEWEIEVFPIESRSSLESETGDYFTDFITSNFAIAENQPEISLRDGKGAIASGANLYTGSSILASYASSLLQGQLEDYLTKTEGYLEEEIPLDEYYTAKSVPESEQTQDYFSKNIDSVLDWYLSAHCQDSNSDLCNTIVTYQDMRRADQIVTDPGFHSLSQSLGGFNEALLQHKQTTQLSISDPLGFDEYQAFAESMSEAVQDSIRSAPEPSNDFNPIRSGAMKIQRLRLVDTFGQIKDLDCNSVLTTEGLNQPSSPYLIALAPRLVQPARLNFRWLNADDGQEEINDQPASSPICGWVLANNLDGSLMIYEGDGTALGLIDETGSWEPFPGDDTPVSEVAQIQNPQLKKMVRSLVRWGESARDPKTGTSTFVSNFISALDSAMDNIEPDSFAQHQELAVLMGRPLALVRASLSLELQGLPAIDQSWNSFRQDLQRNTRETRGFTRVQFPVRLGEYRQLNDGLAGYFKESGDGYQDDIFYSPQADSYEDDHIKTHADDPMTIYQAVDSQPQLLALLIDPRAQIHATSGIVPAKAISVTADQYKPALQAIEVTFLSTPILSELGKLRLPLPTEAGYQWSWLQNVNGVWSQVSSLGVVTRQVFLDSFAGETPDGQAVWARMLDQDYRWIVKLNPDEVDSASTRASVTPKDQRARADLGEEFSAIVPRIEDILEKSCIGKIDTGASFPAQQELREGWLKLSLA